MNSDSLMSFSKEFLFFFQTLDIDLFLKNVFTNNGNTRLVDANSLNEFIADKLIYGLILEYLNNNNKLKMLIKVNDAEHDNSYNIVESNPFDKNGYIFYQVQISNLETFKNYIKKLDYLKEDITFEEQEKKSQAKNGSSVNVLRLLDKICKADKEPLIKLSDYALNDQSILKLPFYKNMSPTNEDIKLSLDDNDTKTKNITDPKSFFISKYYNILYSMNLRSKNSSKDCFYNFIKNNVKASLLKHCTQLVKENTITSSRNKGTTNTILYKTVIENSVLTLESLDSKYSAMDLKLKDKNNNIINEYEYEFDLNNNRSSFIFKNWNVMLGKKITDNYKHDIHLVDTLLNIFKIRELKLQIIINLELLTFSTLDSRFENFDDFYKTKEHYKSSFNRSSIMKKKTQRPEEGHIDQCQLLNILINKLCITEALIEVSLELTSEEEEILGSLNLDSKSKISGKNINDIPPKILVNWFLKNCLFNEKSDESLSGFYRNCLVPAYKKRLPKCLKFFKEKFKGTTFEQNFKSAPIEASQQNEVSSMRQVPSKNLKELLSSDTSLLERQDSLFGSTQERIKLLEKRITPANHQSETKKNKGSDIAAFKKRQMKSNKNKRCTETILEDEEVNNLLAEDLKVKTINPMIEMEGKKFKRAKLETSKSSFQRTGSIKSFSLLDRLNQTFQEPQSSLDSNVSFASTTTEIRKENDFVDELFFKFSERMKANSKQVILESSDSDMIIKATPQKKSALINSPQKSFLLSSAIKETPVSSLKKESPLRNVIKYSGESDRKYILSPHANSDNLIINSSPFKTPHSAIVEQPEENSHIENEIVNEQKARRKLFPE
ncbi:hypothetical protein QEN19_000381 [Hanseniaspora menglaensis]